ncbi:hypothetical protein MXB_5714 [Myxobolus squamalis]|nr:hypothetical protein MXB_5714 [Myxobolus squamalis]
MNINFKFATILLGLMNFVSIISYKIFLNETFEVKNVSITGCLVDFCYIQAGTRVDIWVDFISHISTSVLRATAEFFNLPLGPTIYFFKINACDHLKPACPIFLSERYQFSTSTIIPLWLKLTAGPFTLNFFSKETKEPFLTLKYLFFLT